MAASAGREEFQRAHQRRSIRYIVLSVPGMTDRSQDVEVSVEGSLERILGIVQDLLTKRREHSLDLRISLGTNSMIK